MCRFSERMFRNRRLLSPPVVGVRQEVRRRESTFLRCSRAINGRNRLSSVPLSLDTASLLIWLGVPHRRPAAWQNIKPLLILILVVSHSYLSRPPLSPLPYVGLVCPCWVSAHDGYSDEYGGGVGPVGAPHYRGGHAYLGTQLCHPAGICSDKVGKIEPIKCDRSTGKDPRGGGLLEIVLGAAPRVSRREHRERIQQVETRKVMRLRPNVLTRIPVFPVRITQIISI